MWEPSARGAFRNFQVRVENFTTNPQFSEQQELFRSDAKATADGAWLGGWEFRGGQKTSEARWWVFQVKSDVPWLFCKRDPKRIIAALKMLPPLSALWYMGVRARLLVASLEEQTTKVIRLQPENSSRRSSHSPSLLWNCQNNFELEIRRSAYDGNPENKIKLRMILLT